MVGNCPGNGLADPPRSIGGEFIALGIIELANGLDQAQIALLNQIEQGQAASNVALGNGHNKAQVRFDHLVVRFLIAFSHLLGKLRFLIRGEKRNFADLLEIHPHGVVDAHVLGELRRIDELFLLDQLQIFLTGKHIVRLGEHFHDVGNVDVHARRLQCIIDHVRLPLVGIDGIERVDQIFGTELFLLLGAFQKLLKLFVQQLVIMLFLRLFFFHHRYVPPYPFFFFKLCIKAKFYSLIIAKK